MRCSCVQCRGLRTCPTPRWLQPQQPTGFPLTQSSLPGTTESGPPGDPRRTPLGRHLSTEGSPTGGKTSSPPSRLPKHVGTRDRSVKKSKRKWPGSTAVIGHNGSSAILSISAALFRCNTVGCDHINNWAPTDVPAPRSQPDLSDTIWSLCFDWHPTWAASSSSPEHVARALAGPLSQCWEYCMLNV
jgi:hypothetical protein